MAYVPESTYMKPAAPVMRTFWVMVIMVRQVALNLM